MSPAATVSAGRGPDRPPVGAPVELLRQLRARTGADPVTHVERVPARAGEQAPWPDWTPEPLRAAFARRGVVAPWRHQARAADLAYAGRSVVVATGTASGKSLAYQLPALATLLADPRATVLYLAPTKALAADQLRAVAGLELDGIRPACYDGDTPRAERDWIRQHARFVLTNPDMLHHGILPGHARWSGFLRRLAYVIVDECHTYRGCSARTSRTCCAGCAGSAHASAVPPCSSWPRPRRATRRRRPGGSPACRCPPSPRTPHRAAG